jgi:hypothetical protein
MTSIRHLPATSRIFLLGILIVGASYGQGDRGLLTGLVKDPSGAAIAGADIRAVHLATNVATTSQTNAEGNYTIGFLLPGDYTVTASAAGFKQFERTGVKIAVNDRLTLDIALELGQVSEKMIVAADAPLLETTSSSMGTLIDHRRLTELPLYYGNPMMLQFQASGITWNAPLHYQAPWDSSGASQSSINGSQPQSIDFQMDGITNNRRNNNVAYTPSVEFIQEYKVETVAYDASQGHGAAWVNATMKSGTNEIHGSAYYYIQNKYLNANGFFNNMAGQKKGDFDYLRFQTSAGGPLIRNKTFWFAGIERIRPGSGVKRIFTVPTAQGRNGDLSYLLPLGSQYQIYDPFTTTNLNNGRFSRQPFPNNIIPASRISPIAKKILAYYPDPNGAPAPTREGLNNYIYEEGYNQNNYMSFSARMDHHFNEKDRIYGRVGLSTNTLNANAYDFAKGASGGHNKRKVPVAAFDYTRVFNATTVLNLRYGYTRSYDGTISLTEGFDLSTLGFPKSLADQLWYRMFPPVGFGSNSYTTTNVASPAYTYGSINSLAASVSRTQSRHFLRMGVDYRASLTTNGSHAGEAGVFNFTGGYMNGPLDNAPTPPLVASSLAGLLLGVSTNSYVNKNASFAASVHATGLFLQDDWKVSDKLTLNLGLRYEYEGAPVERFDRGVRGFDYGVSSPVEAAAQAAYARSPIPELPANQFQAKGGLTFLGVNGQPRVLYDAPKLSFMPRFGFAYSIDQNTVMRGGYGIFFGQLGYTRNINQTGFSQTTNIVPTLNSGVTFIATLADPFPDGLLNPIGAGAGIATNLGQNIGFQNTNLGMPYNQRWSYGIQRVLPGGFLVDMSYVGSRAVALETSRSLNYTPGEYLSKSPVRDDATINRLSRNVPNPMAGLLPGTSLNGANTSVGRLLYRYPHFGSVSTSTSEGYSWYHSAQTRFERRFAEGYTIMGSWTWSKNMEANTFLNAFDARPEEVISDSDRTHRFTASGILELPFGRGKPWLPDARGFTGALVNGWQLSGAFQHQTGEPLGFGDFIYYGDPKDIVLPRSERTRERWFNTGGFETNSSRQRSSAVRFQPSRFSGVRAPGITTLDLSAIKKAQLTERFSFELRVEALQALNNQLFDAPNTSVTAGTFGSITAMRGFSNRRMQLALYVRF